MEHRTTTFRHPHKNVNGQIITDIYQKTHSHPTIFPLQQSFPKNSIKSIPYTLARRICTIISDKNLKNRLKELNKPTPTTLMRKGFQLAKRYHKKKLLNLKNHSNKRPPEHTS